MTAASMCTAHCAATPDKNMEGALTLRLIAEYITLSNSTYWLTLDILKIEIFFAFNIVGLYFFFRSFFSTKEDSNVKATVEQNKEPRLSEYYPICDKEKYSLIAFSMTQSTRIVEVEQFAGINEKNLICDDGAKKKIEQKKTHIHIQENFTNKHKHTRANCEKKNVNCE